MTFAHLFKFRCQLCLFRCLGGGAESRKSRSIYVLFVENKAFRAYARKGFVPVRKTTVNIYTTTDSKAATSRDSLRSSQCDIIQLWTVRYGMCDKEKGLLNVRIVIEGKKWFDAFNDFLSHRWRTNSFTCEK